MKTTTNTDDSAPLSSGTMAHELCQVGVVVRAMVAVEVVLVAGLLYREAPLADWLMGLAVANTGAIPATLFWLVAGCALKSILALWPKHWQYAALVVLGALAGCVAAAISGWMVWRFSASWLASACTGGLLAGILLSIQFWRSRAQMPAETAARLAELQARIRPHFLFNTLNSAMALVREDPSKAEEVLADLADLFRHALTQTNDRSTVATELDLARRYLAIEQVRFGDRLHVDWSLDSRVNAAVLPALLLQPLVENAVIHGVEPNPSGARIRVSTRLRAGMVHIRIHNSVGDGDAAQSVKPGRKGHGVALNNVRQRLQLLHDLHGQFRARMHHDGYEVLIQIPALQPASS